jgi:hypothetical protein
MFDPFKIVLCCVNSLLTSYISIIVYGSDTLGQSVGQSEKFFPFTETICCTLICGRFNTLWTASLNV